MIIDLVFFQEFYNAEKIKDYNQLMVFIKKYDKQFYEKLNCYIEEHDNLYMPVSLHFLAHYLLAPLDNANYTIAYNILENFPEIQPSWKKELEICKLHYIKYFKTYKHKLKISSSMKNLNKTIIQKRNESIKKYAEKRPLWHNLKISEGRTKKIINCNSGEEYSSIEEAVFETNISYSSIRKSCQHGKIVRGTKFKYG